MAMGVHQSKIAIKEIHKCFKKEKVGVRTTALTLWIVGP